MNNKMARLSTDFSDLPYEVLLQIFMCLSMVDIILGASSVCRLWRKACRDPVIWRTINLYSVKSEQWINRRNLFGILNGLNGRFAPKNMQISVLRSALNLGGGEVNCLVLHSLMFLNDEQLVGASASSKNLKRVVLPSRNLLTESGMVAAFKNWKHLESLTIPYIYYSSRLMSIAGSYCKNLRVLKLTCPLTLELAATIVAYAPRLRVLSIWCTKFYKDAIAHILKHLKHLEILNLSHSHLAVRATRINSTNSIVIPIELSDIEIAQRASRIKIFVACQDILATRSCKCPASYKDLREWHENDESVLLKKE